MAITGNSGRPIGLPKTGGRKKGTPNRATLTLQERLEAVDCDPLLELARIAMNANNPIEIRVRCLSEIAPYVSEAEASRHLDRSTRRNKCEYRN